VDQSVHLTGDQERFRFRHRITDGGSFFVAHFEHSMESRVMTDPFGCLVVGQVLDGHLTMSTGREEISPEPGELFLIPAAPMHFRWEGLRAGLVRLDLDVVNRVAAEAAGAASPGGVRFDLSKVVDEDSVRRWKGLVRYLTHEFLGNNAAYSSPLIYAQTVRLLAATVLETFPNTTAAADPVRPGGADVSAVRRAVAFIDEHAGEPIGVTDIAEAARLGPRTLQDAFRRHLDTTPMTYLRRVRLDGAHRDLQAAAPSAGTTVADIARRWGFAHHGRFAAVYAEHYGRPPRQTLHG
jgi:AraC-like DNA-binding protein